MDIVSTSLAHGCRKLLAAHPEELACRNYQNRIHDGRCTIAENVKVMSSPTESEDSLK